GEAGVLTRVLAAKYGAFLTFARLEPGVVSASGQPTIHDLMGLYRWREMGAGTRVFGVVGWPVAHSYGPHAHNAALTAEQIDGIYVPMPVGPTYEDFVALMDYLTGHPELDVHGLSVTLPHKEHALRWLTANGFACADSGRRAGAVNTLTHEGAGEWAGDNTDIEGVVGALASAYASSATGLRGLRVAILGAGGVARAAVTGLVECGAKVTIFNRTAERARTLAHEMRCDWRLWQQRPGKSVDIIVNCTSVGMLPKAGESPLPAGALDRDMIVVDTVYNPAQTHLLREAARHGCKQVSGMEIFIRQAAAQFARWHGRPAPLEAMRAALWDG
ncbi:MAG: shikimate dehydrogenase, partial [Planctomycetota bacterium]